MVFKFSREFSKADLTNKFAQVASVGAIDDRPSPTASPSRPNEFGSSSSQTEHWPGENNMACALFD